VVWRVAARAVSWHFGFGLFITLACKRRSLGFSKKSISILFVDNDNKEAMANDYFMIHLGILYKYCIQYFLHLSTADYFKFINE